MPDVLAAAGTVSTPVVGRGMIDALLPVGRDCDCGFPLVWFGDRQVCAVYGRHPAGRQPVHFRDRRAEFADLIETSLAATDHPKPRRSSVDPVTASTRRAERHRHRVRVVPS